MASGTSVIGSQQLGGQLPWTVRWYYMSVTKTNDTPPSRVGFHYVLRTEPGRPSAEYVIDTRPIYTGGIYLVIPPVYNAGSDGYTFWAEWDVAGLAWSNGAQ